MCGFAGGIGKAPLHAVRGCQSRGPDATKVVELMGFWLTHSRLSIVDLGAENNQPVTTGGITLAFCGEIWNRAELDRMHGHAKGDAWTFANVIAKKGLQGLKLVKGMWSVAWIDHNKKRLHVARDRFGEVPVHINHHGTFASEMKIMADPGPMLTPGCVAVIEPGKAVDIIQFADVGVLASKQPKTIEESGAILRKLLESSVKERCVTADVPTCFLLSGGLDSSIVLAMADKVLKGDKVAYTAVHDKKSSDLRHARIMADYAGVELVEVEVPAPTPDDLSAVVKEIEMDAKPQVEIAHACRYLGDAMRSDGFRVTYSGEGADELFGSYGFMYHQIAALGYTEARRQAFMKQHRTNFPRCNKVFMRRHVECRLPFLNEKLVHHVLAMPKEMIALRGRPKHALEIAAEGLVPDAIIKRPKEAFQVNAGIRERAANTLADPKKFYTAEFKRFKSTVRHQDIELKRNVVVLGQAPASNVNYTKPLSGRPAGNMTKLLGKRWRNRCDVVNLLPTFPGSAEGKGDLYPKQAAKVMFDRLQPSLAGKTVVVLGKNVWRTVGGKANDPWGAQIISADAKYILAPHPSGVNQFYNDDADVKTLAKDLERRLKCRKTK